MFFFLFNIISFLLFPFFYIYIIYYLKGCRKKYIFPNTLKANFCLIYNYIFFACMHALIIYILLFDMNKLISAINNSC